MASEEEKAELKKMIESFYEIAGVPLNWNLEVNEQVAEVFGIMINETEKCSNAFTWGTKTTCWKTINILDCDATRQRCI